MGDLLVPLYSLADREPNPSPGEDWFLQRPLSADRNTVVDWVAHKFGDRWADETEIAFSSLPITCLVALDSGKNLLGFACYDVSWKGFFGPLGVSPDHRGKGIGTDLLLRCLRAMWECGYAYAIIGGSGADEYYRHAVGAIPIPDSTPGPYRHWIRSE